MPTIKRTPRPWVKQAPAKPNQGRADPNRDVYDTVRWRTIRQLHLAEHPACVLCKAEGRLTLATVLDHIVPINAGGDAWDSANHQGLCKRHHQKKSATERWNSKPKKQ